MKTDQKGQAMTVALGEKKAAFCTILWLQNSQSAGHKRQPRVGGLGTRCRQREIETDGWR